MIEAPIPLNEAARLNSVHDLKILDTPPEERFDRINRLATMLFDVPIATFTIVESEREWFKSCAGLDESEGSRAASFCGHALVEPEMLVIPDTLLDHRFKDNPMVLGKPFLRFYAGIPVMSADGNRVGVLCIKDTKPRMLVDREIDALKSLAKWAEVELNSSELSKALEGTRSAKDEMSTVFNLCDDLVCVANTDGYFERINPSFVNILGYTEEELFGKPFLFFIHDEDKLGTLSELEKLGAGEKSIRFNNRYRKQNGDYVWLQWNSHPIGNKVYAIARDISEQKEIEEMKDDLISLVSHQLKTPTAQMRGYIDNMLHGVVGPINEKQKEYFNKIDRLAGDSLHLINDILEVSRIERGVIEIETQENKLISIIEESLTALEFLQEEKDVKVAFDASVEQIMVIADRRKTVEVIRNIIHNALKFAPEGSTVDVSITRDDKLAQVSIVDKGPGVPPEQIEKLFTKDKILQTNNNYESTGLGLFLAKELATLQGGDIVYRKDEAGGAHFTVSIPLVDPNIIMLN